jgi:phosphatidylserine/phosphatidylglycerophosphate/cardiolipin synthase-like enzyme
MPPYSELTEARPAIALRRGLAMRLRQIAFVAFAILVGADAHFASATEPEIHYAPVENLEHIDIGLIRSARKSVDLAMYTLTDWAIIAALKDARARGIDIRIVLDPSVRQAYDKLADIADVVRVKKRGPLMHLKAYSIDGALLRTGSANLSPSGLKQQDNDLIILRDPVVAAQFEARFDQVYLAADPMRFGDEGKKSTESAPPSSVLPPDLACPIKGNVNNKGQRIYHAPGDRDYDRVVMENCDHGICARGKRWFCSPAEAESDGWRHALR